MNFYIFFVFFADEYLSFVTFSQFIHIFFKVAHLYSLSRLKIKFNMAGMLMTISYYFFQVTSTLYRDFSPQFEKLLFLIFIMAATL